MSQPVKKLKDAGDGIQKNAQDIARHSKLLRERTKNINTFISTDATFNLVKNPDDTSNQVQDNVKEIASLKQMTGNENNNFGDIEKE